MFFASSFRQNGHLSRVATNVDPTESRVAFAIVGGESPCATGGKGWVCNNFLAVFRYSGNPSIIADKMSPLIAPQRYPNEPQHVINQRKAQSGRGSRVDYYRDASVRPGFFIPAAKSSAPKTFFRKRPASLDRQTKETPFVKKPRRPRRRGSVFSALIR